MSEINPGIRMTVQYLNMAGYRTVDSGDGETHDFECDREVGYVVVQLYPSQDLCRHADQIAKLLEGRGRVKLGPLAPPGEKDEFTYIQANYSPIDGLKIIDISNITDALLYPKCRGCDAYLEPDNCTMADGCPCNSSRGINHGLVADDVCTCSECDPEQTGSSRRRTT